MNGSPTEARRPNVGRGRSPMIIGGIMRSKRIAEVTVLGWIVLAVLAVGACTYLTRRADRPDGKEGRVGLSTGQIAPNETEGAPYPPAKPSDRVPNVDHEIVPVPTGPRVGDMKPSNPAFRLKEEGTPAKEAAPRTRR